jgi:hypothetical protein
MRDILVAITLALSVVFPALAGELRVYEDRSGRMALTDEPCVDPRVLKHVPPSVPKEVRALFRKVNFVLEGRDIAACWLLIDNGEVAHVFDEDNDHMPVPIQAFKPVVRAGS